MQGKRIAWSAMLGRRRMPGDKFRRPAQFQPSSSQRWHVKGLADMASSVRAIRVLVENRAARGEIHHRGESYESHGPPQNPSSKLGFRRNHEVSVYLSALDERPSALGCKKLPESQQSGQPVASPRFQTRLGARKKPFGARDAPKPRLQARGRRDRGARRGAPGTSARECRQR